jgi:hypothetical protein
MPSFRSITWPAALFVAVGLSAVLVPQAAWAAPTLEQRAALRTAEAGIKKAGNLYKAKKFAEAGEAVKQVQQAVTELSAAKNAKEFEPSLAPLRKQLVKAHALLTKEGIELPPLPAGLAEGKAGGSQVSFSKQVAPLLVAKCGGCHVRAARGGLSMATFADLERGSRDAGVVIMAGNSKGSRIVELIEMGDMPRGDGPKVSADELAALSTWIDQGAKFDGADRMARLDAGAPAPAAAAATQLKPLEATGKEAVQFARDLGPILLANCTGCHGDRNPRGQLSFTSFDRLLKGGQSGPIVMPGKPADSLLVKKLRGTASGQRMPMGKAPLSEDLIARFEQWIADQARYDGPDPLQPLTEAVALVEARNASHEELTRKRAALAAKTWGLMLPDSKPSQHETANFLVMGNVGESTLAEVGKSAEASLPKLAKLLSLPAWEPLVKGRMTLFVFDKRYDYAEIGTMVEKREIPQDWRGHWRFTIVDAYGCIVPPPDKQYGLAPLVAQQVAGVYVASLGKVPRWFAEGSARTMASRIDPKDPRVRRWDDEVGGALSRCEKPDSFITGGMLPEDADILSYSFVKFLATSGTRYQALLKSLREGAPFEPTFARVFGGSPNQVTAAWAGRAAKRGR